MVYGYFVFFGVCRYFIQTGLTYPALGDVDDSFYGDVIGVVGDNPQICKDILYFAALVEVYASDDLIWDVTEDKPFFKQTGLCICTVQYGKILIIGIAFTYFGIYGINDISRSVLSSG